LGLGARLWAGVRRAGDSAWGASAAFDTALRGARRAVERRPLGAAHGRQAQDVGRRRTAISSQDGEGHEAPTR